MTLYLSPGETVPIIITTCGFTDYTFLLLLSFWSKVNSRTHTPVNAVWLVVLFSIVLVCVGIGSTQTVVAIFSITAPALDLSYIAVILAHLVYRKRVRFIEGPYTLGKWGLLVNTIAICWVCFISVVLFFPSTRPVTPYNMLGFFTLKRPSWRTLTYISGTMLYVLPGSSHSFP